jgi:hypothetical protein
MSYAEFALYVDSTAYTVVTAWAATTAFTVGQIRRQLAAPTAGNERCFVCIVAGTSGSTEPTWVVTKGAKTTDSTVTWMECTALPGVNGDSANTNAWKASQGSIALGVVIKNGASDHYFICTTAGAGGTGTEPSWNTTTGGTTTDATVTWTCIGAISSFSTRWASPAKMLQNPIWNSSNWLVNANITIYVGDDHSETGTANYVPTSACQLLCVDHTAAFPLTSANLKTTAALTTTFTFWNASVNGYIYGLAFSAANNSTVASGLGPGRVRFDQCSFSLTGGAANIRYQLGDSSNIGGLATFAACSFSTSAASQGISLVGAVRLENCSLAGSFGGSANQIFMGAGTYCNFVAEGCDFSTNVSSGANLVGTGSPGQPQGYMLFKDCLIRSDYTAIFRGGDAGMNNLIIDLNRCDSGGTNYRNERHSCYSTLTTSTAVVRAGGASDGTTPISHQVAPTTNAFFPYSLFDSLPLTTWNSVTGSNRNVTIYGVANDSRVPNNSEVWFDAEYLGSASTPQGSYVRGGMTVLGTASALTADSSAWDGAATARANSHAYVVGDVIKTASNPGRVFFCTGAGISLSSEPTGGTPTIYPTWNPSDLTSVSLTGGNLTVTSSASDGGVRGTISQTTGKYYFEGTYTTVAASSTFGVASAVMGLTQANCLHAAGIQTLGGGIVAGNNSLNSGIGTITAGMVICVAIDLGNNTFWIRENNGNWNGSGTANPATNTGGYSLNTGSSIPSGTAVYPFFSSNTPGTALVANFGASSFAYTPPSGFVGFSQTLSSQINYSTAVDGGSGGDGTATFRAGCRFSQTLLLGGSSLLSTWSPTDNNHITLSNGNLTATHSASASNTGVRSAYGQSTGKFYFELTMITTPGNGGWVGLGTSTTSFAGGGGAAMCGLQCGNGNLYINGLYKGVTIGFGNGDVVCAAVDMNNKLIWFRINGGNWNGSGTANPATGAGGFDISTPFSTGTAAYAMSGNDFNSGASFTANFGATSFAQTVPSGFVGGPALVPPPQPQQPGYLYAYPKFDRASATYYIDPLIKLS